MKQEKERTIRIINGNVDKEIYSTEPLVIENNCHINGDIKAPEVTIGDHVVVKGAITAQNITIGNMCEIGDVTADKDVSVGQMSIVGNVWAGETVYIMGYSSADSVFGDIEVIAENGCDLGEVQSFGSVTLATRTLVNGCCGSELVDCFEDVKADYLMSEKTIRTGEDCHIKLMEVRQFN